MAESSFKDMKKKLKRAKKQKRLLSILDALPDQHERQQLDIAASLQRAVQYVVNAAVPGDIIEFGTATGFTASVMARTITELKRSEGRDIWLCDSFEGLPDSSDNEVDGISPHVVSGVWGAGTCTRLNAQQLKAQVADFISADRIHVLEGWFSETTLTIPAERRFAIVHVDGDLYQSAIDCLTPILERKQIEEGGLVIFDDWNTNRGKNAFGERRAWAELSEKHQVECEDFGHSAWGGKAFIIHSYS